MRLEFGHHLPRQNFDKKGSIRDLDESGLIDMSIPPFECNSSGFQLQARSADATKNQKNEADMMLDEPCGSNGNLMIMAELRKKCLKGSSSEAAFAFHELFLLRFWQLVIGTVQDLQKHYPTNVTYTPMLDTEHTPLCQGLVHLHNALKSVGDSWANNHKRIADFGSKAEGSLKNFDLEQLGGKVLEKLTYMIRIARETFDIMDEDKRNNERTEDCNMEDIHGESDLDNKFTTSAPPELTFSLIFFPPILLPIRLQEVKDFAKKPIAKVPNEVSRDAKATNTMPKISNFISNLMAKVKEQVVAPKPPQSASVAEPSAKLNSNMMATEKEQEIAPPMHPSPPSDLHSNATTALPQPPPPLPSTGSVPPPPPLTSAGLVPPPQTMPSTCSVPQPPPLAPMAMTTGAAPPPPPPLCVAKALRPRKTNNKLKRSTHMGNLYCTLKRKLEGSGLQGKNSQGRKSAIGGSTGEKQGMADALAEMTKRSAYFQQIEEDVQKHEKLIMEMKVAINSFQTKDMDELLKFQKHVEENLEQLTDETQVLARFEDFPTKKLETLRMASALYLKLKGIATDLQNWKVAPPLGQLLDKVEAYFNKIKRDLDVLERNKEDESKLFQSHNIHFDFNIFTQIKESMVDVSSSCMELALRERRQAKAAADAETGCQTKGTTKACAKMLWKAFQLAFRVYSFAGGQDDRADKLTKELAHEIENDPEHK